jgi:hypothetical protein
MFAVVVLRDVIICVWFSARACWGAFHACLHEVVLWGNPEPLWTLHNELSSLCTTKCAASTSTKPVCDALNHAHDSKKRNKVLFF